MKGGGKGARGRIPQDERGESKKKYRVRFIKSVSSAADSTNFRRTPVAKNVDPLSPSIHDVRQNARQSIMSRDSRIKYGFSPPLSGLFA